MQIAYPWNYVVLFAAALLSVGFSLLFYFLNTKTAFSKLKKIHKQLIIGIVFGILAVLGTEFGIPINGAQVNCRDAAVLSAGLIFGGPAGFIAGTIGGLERFVAVYWGVGSFTQIACSVSTFLAGIYAWLLRRFIFEGKRPGWALALATGVVMEVFHLTMVFVTNMGEMTKAFNVVKACSIPMITANGISVMLACLSVTLVSKEKIFLENARMRISQIVQFALLITVVFCFVVTSVFVFSIQNSITVTQRDILLKNTTEDVNGDMSDIADDTLSGTVKDAERDYQNGDSIAVILERYGIYEFNYINVEGIIIQSSEPTNINFDMYSGVQSAEFMQNVLKKAGIPYAQPSEKRAKDGMLMKYAGIKTGGDVLQIGYDVPSYMQYISTNVKPRLYNITKNRSIGENGYVVLLDSDKNVISPLGYSAVDFAEALANYPEKGVTYDITVKDVPFFLSYTISAEVRNYYILTMYPQEEALRSRDIAMYVNSFMEILIFAVIYIMVYLMIKLVIVKKIEKVNSTLQKITTGDLEQSVDVRTNAEFTLLSNSINETVDALKRYIAEASARIDKELEFAKSIQLSALPTVNASFKNRKEMDIYAYMDTAKEVGGDFYDFYLTKKNVLNFLIADVSGKGIPAAMFMMRAKTELKTLSESDIPIEEVFAKGNSALCEGNDAGMFVTAWQGTMDLDDGTLTYVNAGHNPPLIKRVNGQFEYIKEKPNFVLAGMSDLKYRSHVLKLEEGDIIFLYTDGVTEAVNDKNELYGENRLLSAVNSAEYSNMKELCDFVKSDLNAFVGETPQADDITMLAFKYLGSTKTAKINFVKIKSEDISTITSFVTNELENMNCPIKAKMQISIAIDEIYSNIVKFAYPDGFGPATIEVSEIRSPHAVKLRFIDKGKQYNPLENPDPDITLSAEDRQIGGLGIFMVKKTMDEVSYEYKNGKNILTIIKKLDVLAK